MSNNLYEILDEYRQLEDELREAGGELTPELEQRLAINHDELELKMDSYAKMRVEKLTRAESIQGEINRLVRLKEQELKIARELEERMRIALLTYGELDRKGIKRFATSLFNFSTRKSTAYTYDESAVPAEYWRTPPPVEPVPVLDKEKLKADFKAGKEVTGITAQTNYGITIR